MITTMMRCAYCGTRCRYPEDFPDALDARCTACTPTPPAPRPSLWARVRAWWATNASVTHRPPMPLAAARAIVANRPETHARLRRLVYQQGIVLYPGWTVGMWSSRNLDGCCGRLEWSPAGSVIKLRPDSVLDVFVLAHELGHYFAIWLHGDASEEAADNWAFWLLAREQSWAWQLVCAWLGWRVRLKRRLLRASPATTAAFAEKERP